MLCDASSARVPPHVIAPPLDLALVRACLVLQAALLAAIAMHRDLGDSVLERSKAEVRCVHERVCSSLARAKRSQGARVLVGTFDRSGLPMETSGFLAAVTAATAASTSPCGRASLGWHTPSRSLSRTMRYCPPPTLDPPADC